MEIEWQATLCFTHGWFHILGFYFYFLQSSIWGIHYLGNCFYIYKLTPYVVSMTIHGSLWYLRLMVPLTNLISMYFQWQMLWHLVFLVRNPLHLVFGLNKLSSINFWVKFYFYYLPVAGWWNDLIIIWQIVLKWVLQGSCSFSVIVETVCSITAPAVFLIFWYVCEHLIVWYPVWLFKLLTLFYCWWTFCENIQ